YSLKQNRAQNNERDFIFHLQSPCREDACLNLIPTFFWFLASVFQSPCGEYACLDAIMEQSEAGRAMVSIPLRGIRLPRPSRDSTKYTVSDLTSERKYSVPDLRTTLLFIGYYKKETKNGGILPFCVTAEGSKIGGADGESSAEWVKCAFSDVVSRFEAVCDDC
ncbi:MAG: hypothetical protein AAFN11_23375, partial [Chloroflexota bacterium]